MSNQGEFLGHAYDPCYDKAMNENESVTFEDRVYANPTTSRDERLSFIDTLRETQANNTAQINADTYAMGSQLPSNLGGLSGAEDTFIARYQTPQTNQTVANLRLAAQQSALNTALSNLQNAYKKRYNDAMLKYQNRAASPTTNNPSNDDPKSTLEGVGDNPDATTGQPSTSTDLLDQPLSVAPDPVTGNLGIYETDEKGNVINTIKPGNITQGTTKSAQTTKTGQKLENFLESLQNLFKWE